jgi:Domain of unknown function (DUF5916)/Carbohydrate family 9 binding domain-like
MKCRALVACVVLCALTLAATPPPPPPIQIHRADGPIVIDGRLDDAGWKTAARIDTFYETSPADNTPPAAKTTAWLSYDDKYFYIGVRCDDPHPEKIRAPYIDRDLILGTDDNLAVFLDTRNDRHTALELRVNPRGIQTDGIFNDSGGIEDFSPDYFYDTAATIDSGGWSAEYRIPFSSLRYSDAPEQTWNIMIWRNYPREFRYAYQSVPIPRDANCYMCFMQPIVGLTNLPKAGHMVIAPYVTGQQTATADGLGGPLQNGNTKADGGLDLKWTPSADHAVDLAINPDFSQIESDVAQITANQRFALFFPEKRPFFLEGFDLFDTPLQVAYTRTVTDPKWGVRSTGNIAGTAYTALVTSDQGGGSTIIPGALGSQFAPEDFKSIDVIARARHDMGHLVVSGVFTDREIKDGGYNRVLGPDFVWRPAQTDSVAGELLLSQNENPNRPDLSGAWDGRKSTSHAAYANWSHVVTKWDLFMEAKDIGKDFRADLGFIPQVGFREEDGQVALHFYPEKGLLRSVRPSIFIDHQSTPDNGTIFREVSMAINVQGVKNLAAGIALRPGEESFVNGKLLSRNYVNFAAQIDPSRRYTRITFQGYAGQIIDFANARVGNGASMQLTATVRPVDRLTLEPIVSSEWINVDGGRLYTAAVDRLKVTYSFSSKSLVRVIGQYVTTDRAPQRYLFPVSPHDAAFLGSILYSYKINWQTVLFAGYGDDRVLNNVGNDLVKLDRSFFVKVSYAIQR